MNPSGAIAEHQMTKEVAKVSAREILKERSGLVLAGMEEEFVKNARIKFPQDTIRNARIYKKDYERTLPEKLAPEVENKMWVRAKQLKDEFTYGMLPRDELHPVKEFLVNGTMKLVANYEKINNQRVIQRESEWQSKNEPKIQEFKRLMRHLDSNNPNAGDIEKFRPHTKKVKNV